MDILHSKRKFEKDEHMFGKKNVRDLINNGVGMTKTKLSEDQIKELLDDVKDNNENTVSNNDSENLKYNDNTHSESVAESDNKALLYLVIISILFLAGSYMIHYFIRATFAQFYSDYRILPLIMYGCILSIIELGGGTLLSKDKQLDFEKFKVLFCLFFILALFNYFTVAAVNNYLDFHKTYKVYDEVTNKSIFVEKYKKIPFEHTHYCVNLKNRSVDVGKEIYERVSVGNIVVLENKQGLLGLEHCVNRTDFEILDKSLFPSNAIFPLKEEDAIKFLDGNKNK